MINLAFDGYELGYTDEEANQANIMWLQGKNLEEIADELRPKNHDRCRKEGQWEAFIMLADLARRGLLEKREGGIFGVL